MRRSNTTNTGKKDMNKFARLLVASAVTIALAGCAERTEDVDANAQNTFDENGNVIAGPGLGAAFGQTYDVRVTSTPRGLQTGSAETLEIRARLVDLSNNVVADAPVTFVASGGVLS